MDYWFFNSIFKSTVGLIFLIMITLEGCVTVRPIIVGDDVDRVKIDKLLEASDLKIEDHQFALTSKEFNNNNIRSYLNIKNATQIDRQINIVMEPCLRESMFWENQSSIISLLTFSIIPFNNSYICKTSVEVVDQKQRTRQKYYLDQKYVQSFGVITSIFLGIADSVVVTDYKKKVILSILNEVSK